MKNIPNYILGQWQPHKGNDYARKIGNKNLRKMTFQERGRMLKALALFLMERKEKYYPISALTGATRADSWIDIEGGIGTLFAYASLRKKFPDQPFYVEGETAALSKLGTFIGHHIMVPRAGVALHINAFNFPIWGMLEKISCNLLAGMPAIVKPAEQTSYLSQAMSIVQYWDWMQSREQKNLIFLLRRQGRKLLLNPVKNVQPSEG